MVKDSIGQHIAQKQQTARREMPFGLLEHYIRERLAHEIGSGTMPEINVPSLVEQALAAIDGLITTARVEQNWLYLRIPLPAHAPALFISGTLAPALLRLKVMHPIDGWWWLYKTDPYGNAIRLRISSRRGFKLNSNLIVSQTVKQLGCDVTLLHYEPELRLFGGVTGIQLAHEQFSKESEFLAEWMLGNGPRLPTLPHGLSLALILKLLRACGLDSFECSDLFERLCMKRPAPQRFQPLVRSFRSFARKIIAYGPDAILQLYEGNNASLLGRYSLFLESFGKNVSRAYFGGHMECGVREFLVPVILFHWNRLGITGLEQVALAHSMSEELAELQHPVTA